MDRSFHSRIGGHLDEDMFEGRQYFCFPLAARLQAVINAGCHNQQFVAGGGLWPPGAVTALL